MYRPGNGKFDVEHIDPFACTHIIYGFVGLSPSNEILVLDPYNDLEENWGMLIQFPVSEHLACNLITEVIPVVLVRFGLVYTLVRFEGTEINMIFSLFNFRQR